MRINISSRAFRAMICAALSVAIAGCSEGGNEPARNASPSGTAITTAGSLATDTSSRISTVPTAPSGIDLGRVPVPAGAKNVVVTPEVATYVTDASVAATEREVARLMEAEGWSPYGSTPGTQNFKQFKVRLTASVGIAAGQGGKTTITYTAQNMAVDLPALANAQGLQYSDSTKQVVFETTTDMAGVEKYYRETLGKSDWKATTDEPFKVDFKDELIFRNPARDLITLKMQEFDGKRRVTLKQLSAAEVAEQEARYLAQLDQKKKDAEKPLPQFKLPIPAGAQKLEQTKHRLDFEVPTGTAKAVTDVWSKELTAGGWTLEVTKLDQKVGSIVFRKARQFLSVDFIDPGFLPGHITVTATGMELEK